KNRPAPKSIQNLSDNTIARTSKVGRHVTVDWIQWFTSLLSIAPKVYTEGPIKRTSSKPSKKERLMTSIKVLKKLRDN
ncbi:hypothetical protein OnM2_035083, partial [Erysiphe neolycopersici]